jgi:hypothetical protein
MQEESRIPEWRQAVGAGTPAGAKRPVSRFSRLKWTAAAGAAGVALGIGASEGVRYFKGGETVAEASAQKITEEESKIFQIVQAAAGALGAKVDATADDLLKWLGVEEKAKSKKIEDIVERAKKATGREDIDVSTIERVIKRVATIPEPAPTVRESIDDEVIRLKADYERALQTWRQQQNPDLGSLCPILKKVVDYSGTGLEDEKKNILKKDSSDKNVIDYCGENWK